MKKFIIILLVLPLMSGSKPQQKENQNLNLQIDLIKQIEVEVDTLKPPIITSATIELRKKTDSMLTQAEINNNLAAAKLQEVKNLKLKSKELTKELKNLRTDLKKNIQYTVKMFKEKQLEIKKHNQNNIVKINEPKIDSTYKKGSIFKKGKWVYLLEIDGKHYELIK